MSVTTLERSLGGYGTAYTNRKPDSLEPRLFSYLDGLKASGIDKPTVLDLACGHGGLTLRLLEAGAQVKAVDLQAECIAATSRQVSAKGTTLLRNLHLRVAHFGKRAYWENTPGGVHAVAMVRSFHFLTFDEQREALRHICRVLHFRGDSQPPGKLFGVVLAAESLVGQSGGYDTGVTVYKRHAVPDNAEARAVGITEPVTLLHTLELRSLLVATGFTVEHFETTEYGHHKVVARPTE
jgi:SAM-dependent methyltransferase